MLGKAAALAHSLIEQAKEMSEDRSTQRQIELHQ